MLPHALGHIIADTITENVTGNVFFSKVFALLPMIATISAS